MRAVLDACVLYPPVLRDLLLGMAEAGLYEPKWSERILEEWARATVKLGPGAEAQARGVAVLMREVFPRAMQAAAPGVEGRLVLPDPNDAHVLAVAIASGADAIGVVGAHYQSLFSADPATGEQRAVFDLAWPAGIQEELSQPVAVLLNEEPATLALASAAGFRCFTSPSSFRAYVEREILSLDPIAA